ncbi:MAG: YifB family Mg chelatase-like AAA ATPase [Lachnospiraceae bacterium]|nr:YifB family Mg chelatase-like AAA ATPase [Lachnospiraceae bacterium]
MFGTAVTAAICGIESKRITVEADVSDGLPMFTMVGYLSSEVREAQERVRTALKNSGFRLLPKRVTINLAPADIRKEGSGFDLPIAVAVLTAYGYLPQDALEGVFFAGELSLNGEINGIHGIMSMAAAALECGCHTCIIPMANRMEGAVIQGIRVLGASNISEVINFFTSNGKLTETHINIEEILSEQENSYSVDFAEIQGQEVLRRGAEVAVSGMHNLLIIGPPGVGKSMIAQRIPTILPPLGIEEALEISKIHSIAGVLPEGKGIMTTRPFRAPHHTITRTALAGGGRVPRPGEVSLAHHALLYLDELPEFQKDTLEILRQPLEDGQVCIARNTGTYIFPADFMLVASMNPCKCGYYPDRNRCSCSIREVKRYLDHISQPLLDRMDICVEAAPVSYMELSSGRKGESSADIRKRVVKAQKIQQKRYAGTEVKFNAGLKTSEIKKYCYLGKTEESLMKETFEKLQLSGRAYHRILKVARTIADLDEKDQIGVLHLKEAICYRSLDKKYWGGNF